jgi:hypothetical protein
MRQKSTFLEESVKEKMTENNDKTIKPDEVVVEMKDNKRASVVLPPAVEALFAAIQRKSKRFSNVVALRRPYTTAEGRPSEAVELLSVTGLYRIHIHWLADAPSSPAVVMERPKSNVTVDAAWRVAVKGVSKDIDIFLSVVHVWFGMKE